MLRASAARPASATSTSGSSPQSSGFSLTLGNATWSEVCDAGPNAGSAPAQCGVSCSGTLDGQPGPLKALQLHDCAAGLVGACLAVAYADQRAFQLASRWCAAGLYEACFVVGTEDAPGRDRRVKRYRWETLPPMPRLDSYDCFSRWGAKHCLGGMSMTRSFVFASLRSLWAEGRLGPQAFEEFGVQSLLKPDELSALAAANPQANLRHLDFFRAAALVREGSVEKAREALMAASARGDPMSQLMFPDGTGKR